MTSALLWSSVRRREEYGTLSNSSSARMSSPSVAGERGQTGGVVKSCYNNFFFLVMSFEAQYLPQ